MFGLGQKMTLKSFQLYMVVVSPREFSRNYKHFFLSDDLIYVQIHCQISSYWAKFHGNEENLRAEN